MRIVVHPGISPGEMQKAWEDAKRRAVRRPGVVQIIMFEPGNYPLPEEGVHVYKRIPTILRSTGTEVRFWCPEPGGELQVSWGEFSGRGKEAVLWCSRSGGPGAMSARFTLRSDKGALLTAKNCDLHLL